MKKDVGSPGERLEASLTGHLKAPTLIRSSCFSEVDN